MPKLNTDALLFALAWAALAMAGGVSGGFFLGGALALALLIVVMPLSGLILSKTGNFTLERQVRWAILAAAAVGVAAIATL
ncbi:hypothetical protein RCO27_06625 [Sphingosinicella sp. LHD-64]|uniref:hypothetical protein n=1 Tax=Sphingosinicella sp. LHD-64 TaxID=3072139 RepID=UPI00280CAC90|nr:hypothetical protein [Sphingosinicella sp. LHD-64]MDQ8755900.1 hypothetical protein [Sphingosinicella sp. LHD-64]